MPACSDVARVAGSLEQRSDAGSVGVRACAGGVDLRERVAGVGVAPIAGHLTLVDAALGADPLAERVAMRPALGAARDALRERRVLLTP